jgi:hypothetical protein
MLEWVKSEDVSADYRVFLLHCLYECQLSLAADTLFHVKQRARLGSGRPCFTWNKASMQAFLFHVEQPHRDDHLIKAA